MTESWLPQDLPTMDGSIGDLWNRVAGGTDLRPLEAKAIYCVGLIRHLIESAGYLFGGGFHLGAYQLAACCFEPLGAIVTGRNDEADKLLAAGLRFAAEVPADASEDTLIVMSFVGGDFTIRDCINRRHFTAHGGRNFQRGQVVLDQELIVKLLGFAASALDRWWVLVRDGALLDELALARIAPLAAGGQFIFGADVVNLLNAGGTPGGALLHQDAWRN